MTLVSPALALVLLFGVLPSGVSGSGVAPRHVRQDGAAAEHERAVEAVVDAAEELAQWCHRKKLYAARDDAFAAILVLAPDHKEARRKLRFNRQRDGSWKQSSQYRPTKNKNAKLEPEAAARRAAALAPLVESGLAWLERGEGALDLELARTWAVEIDALAPPAGPLRARLDAVWNPTRRTWRRPDVEPAATASTSVAELKGSTGMAAPAKVSVGDHPLDVDLASFGHELFFHTRRAGRVGRWIAALGPHELDVSLVEVEEDEVALAEPEDVTELYAWKGRGRDAWPGYVRRTSELVAGPFGASGNACLARGPLKDPEGVGGEAFAFGGLLERGGWALLVACRPAPEEEAAREIVAFLTGAVRYSGPERDPRWTDEEAYARWSTWAPAGIAGDMEAVIRTEHFIVLGNSDGGKLFGKKMEECYDTIRGIFPFEEQSGRRLMTVFLLRTREQYNELVAKNTSLSLESARRTGGLASRDFYATWYEAPGDPVHIHEATHQIFRNRLRLSGAGSWFQEGVAEYVETRPNERGNAARLVKKRRHTPLREFFGIRSLLLSSEEGVKGGNEAGDHYKQAALLIEFLRESKWGRDRFLDFVHAVGGVPRNDVERIAEVVREVYGATVEEMEDAWVEYCRKR